MLATQNPIEFEGTYPLPEAQLDRFLLKIRVKYPSAEEETKILTQYEKGFGPAGLKRLRCSHWIPRCFLRRGKRF